MTNDINNSRNGNATKQFESLKHRIKGVFEGPETTTITVSSNKTPIKGSTLSKKGQDAISHVNNNRMSIESRDIVPTMQGCLSSTSAAGRTLSFT
jgi:hypothetical protein